MINHSLNNDIFGLVISDPEAASIVNGDTSCVPSSFLLFSRSILTYSLPNLGSWTTHMAAPLLPVTAIPISYFLTLSTKATPSTRRTY